jgi:Flp pilus assembly protein TadG
MMPKILPDNAGARGDAESRPDGLLSSERGSILLLAALMMMVILGSAGLTIDVRNGYVVRAMLQHAVDDGARSALRWSVQGEDTPGGVVAIAPEAVAEALRVAGTDLASAGIAAMSSATATLTGGHLVVAAHSRVPTFFLGLFGIPAWYPEARAGAVLPIPMTLSSSAAGGVNGTVAAGPGLQFPGPAPFLPVTGPPGGDHGLWNGSASAGPSPGSATTPSAGAPLGQAQPAGPCSCDAIAAGDPQSARDALERMGITPGAPGPFEGDLTSGMGFGAMQSASPGGEPTSNGDPTGPGGEE